MDTIISFLMGWFTTLSGVALGGWLVFRTKREGYDTLFAKPESGESFNIADEIGDMPISVSKAKIPEPVMAANELFVNQFAESLASRERA